MEARRVGDGQFMVKFPLGNDRWAFFHFPRALSRHETERLAQMVQSLVVDEEQL